MPPKKTKKKSIEEEIEERVNEEVEILDDIGDNKKKAQDLNNLLSCGDAVLNLHLTGNARGAFLAGSSNHLVGASSAGKTWLSYSIMAESSLHPRFKDFDLIYDDQEDGSQFDIEYYFGKSTAERIQAPNEDGSMSTTVEQFMDSLERRVRIAKETGKGFLWFLDSFDALRSEADISKMEDNMKAREAGKQTGGTFAMSKQKEGAQRYGHIVDRLKETGSMVFLISQQKEKIGSMVPTKTWSGGVWLKFYSTIQLFLDVKEKIYKTIKGKKRNLGTKSKVNITKNRITGIEHKNVPMIINNKFGVDLLLNAIDYLCEESYWGGGKTDSAKVDSSVTFKTEPMTKEKLAQYIDENDKYEELFDAMQNCHNEIEDEIEKRTVRSKRYK